VFLPGGSVDYKSAHDPSVDQSQTTLGGIEVALKKEQLDTLCGIALQAGLAVMEVYRRDFSVWEKKDSSPLTEADLRADAIIRKALEATFPGVYILSEESVSADKETDGCFFLVDPLDGTKEFLKRSDEFTVNIALIDRGRPIAGVVYAPALDELFFAAEGLGAWQRHGEELRALRVEPVTGQYALRVLGSRSHGGEQLTAWLDLLDGEYSFVAAGSSLKFCRIAEGKADIYPRFGPTSQWDTAAAQCILEQAGGIVTDMSGIPLSYGLDRPLLNPFFVATGDRGLLALFSAADC